MFQTKAEWNSSDGKREKVGCCYRWFTWLAELSTNCLCLESPATVTLLWIGSHPILTGARLLSWGCSFPGAWMIWALCQLPLRSGAEKFPVWRDSWDKLRCLRFSHGDETLLKEGVSGCFQACPAGSLWRAGMDIFSLKVGTSSWTGTLKRSRCILCRFFNQLSNRPPSMALRGRGVRGVRETLEQSPSSAIKVSHWESSPDLLQPGAVRRWAAGLRRVIFWSSGNRQLSSFNPQWKSFTVAVLMKIPWLNWSSYSETWQGIILHRNAGGHLCCDSVKNRIYG